MSWLMFVFCVMKKRELQTITKFGKCNSKILFPCVCTYNRFNSFLSHLFFFFFFLVLYQSIRYIVAANLGNKSTIANLSSAPDLTNETQPKLIYSSSVPIQDLENEYKNAKLRNKRVDLSSVKLEAGQVVIIAYSKE